MNSQLQAGPTLTGVSIYAANLRIRRLVPTVGTDRTCCNNVQGIAVA